MQTIWKWKLDKRICAQTIEIPQGTRILSAAFDELNDICIWGLVNPEEESKEQLQVAIVGTGWNIADNELSDMKFLATVRDGVYMWHIFYKKNTDYYMMYKGVKLGTVDRETAAALEAATANEQLAEYGLRAFEEDLNEVTQFIR